MGDLIDRQQALDAIGSWRRDYPLDLQEPIDDCWNSVRELPAVQPINMDETPVKNASNSTSLGEKEGKPDLISRQAAIDALTHEWDGMVTSVFDVIKSLPSAQPEQKTDEWIPISKETNPTKSGWYLVTVMAEFYATDGMWYDIDEPTDMYLRWMPLPEPYRGGEE